MGNSKSNLLLEDVEKEFLVDATSAVNLTRRVPRGQQSWIDAFQKEPQLAVRKDEATGQLPLHIAIDAGSPEDLIKIIVSLNPEAITAVDESGFTPICLGISMKCATSKLSLLLEARHAEKSLLIADANGVLPLHYAIQNQYSTDFILLLLRTAPTAAHIATRMSKFALHFAAEYQVEPAVIDALIKEYPDALEETFDLRLPLHYAAEFKASYEVVWCIYNAYKAAAACKGVESMLPVHLAVQHRAPASVVQLLIEANIDGLLVRDRRGRMPLHYALERKAPDELVLNIITALPTTAAHKGHGSPGDLPLVIALDKHYSHRVVAAICSANPAAVQVQNSFNMLPLRCALRNNAALETVDLLLSLYSTAAAEVDENNRVALHYAISRNMPFELTQALLVAFPDGVRKQDKNGKLPVHIACIRLCTLELLQLLVTAHPAGLSTRDNYQLVPINYAIENDAPLEFFQSILDANKDCLGNKCNNGRLPLHQAVHFKRSTEVISAIVQAYPAAAADHEAKQRRLPLQWAIERLLPLSTLLCIHAANPVQGARVSDKKGWYTIHYAIHFPTPVEIVRLILASNTTLAKSTAHPLHVQFRDSLKTADVQRKLQTPVDNILAINDAYLLLHYAVHNNALPTTVAEILRHTMPYTPTGDLYDQHCDSWAFILSDCEDKYWESVDIVLSSYEHDQLLVQRLADFPDRNTRRAVEIALPKSLHQIVRRLHFFSRYETYKGLSIHKSQYNLIHSAVDHDGVQSESTTNVVLKFSSHRSRFLREVSLRREIGFDSNFVLEMKRSHNAQEDRNYREEIDLKGYSKYPFLLVLVAGERDLQNIAKHENFAGFNVNVARHYAKKLLLALQHVHSVGVVHGDLKPSNVVRHNAQLKIMNFGAASRLSHKEMVTTDLDALGYVAPELANMYRCCHLEKHKQQACQHYDYINPIPYSNVNDQRHSRSSRKSHIGSISSTDDEHRGNVKSHVPDYEDTQRDQPTDLHSYNIFEGQRIIATTAQDMWAFGAILYLLCTGESLFLTTLDEHIDDDQLNLLTDWPDFAKERRLSKVADPSARAIISQLLCKDPLLRPDVEYCLQHPFFTEKSPVVRYIGSPFQYDVVFIYRTSSHGGALQYYDGLPEQQPAVINPLAADSQVQQQQQQQQQEALQQHHSLSTVQSVGTAASESTALDSEQRREREEAMKRMFGSLMEESISSAGSNESNSNQQQQQEESISSSVAEQFAIEAAEKQRLQLQRKHREQCQQRGRIEKDDDFHCQLLCEMLNQQQLQVAVECHQRPTTTTIAATSATTTADVAAKHIDSNNDINDVDVCLTKASAAVILLSKFSFQTQEARLDKLSAESSFDSFYYEIRLSLELAERGLLEKGIYLLTIGETVDTTTTTTSATSVAAIASGIDDASNNQSIDANNNSTGTSSSTCYYNRYFESYMGDMIGRYGGSHGYLIADVVVNAVEEKVRRYLLQHGLGLPLYPMGISVKKVMQQLVQLPTFHIIGEQVAAFTAAACGISDLIRGVGTIVLPSTPYSRPSTGAFAMLDRSRVVTPLLRSRSSFQSSPAMIAVAAAAAAVAGISGSVTTFAAGTAARSLRSASSRRSSFGSNYNNNNSSNNWLPRVLDEEEARATSQMHFTSPETEYYQSKQPQSQLGQQLAADEIQYSYYPNRTSSLDSATTTAASAIGLTTALGSNSARHSPYRFIGSASSAAASPQQLSRATSRGGWQSRPGSVQDLRPVAASVNNSATTAAVAAAEAAVGESAFPEMSRESLLLPDVAAATTATTAAGSVQWTKRPSTTSASFDIDFNQRDDFLYDNGRIVFYNDEVKLPHLTEVVGVERAKTADTLRFLAGKLEVTENEVMNLQDELALLRARMNTKDDEITRLRRSLDITMRDGRLPPI